MPELVIPVEPCFAFPLVLVPPVAAEVAAGDFFLDKFKSFDLVMNSWNSYDMISKGGMTYIENLTGDSHIYGRLAFIVVGEEVWVAG